MHSESDVRRAIRPLLSIYGELNTSEVKKYLHEVMTFDKQDLEPSNSRKETKIIQRIGNIVSHQECDYYCYPEGFIVEKTQDGDNKQMALFYLAQGFEEKAEAKKKRRARKNKALKAYSNKVSCKTDWEDINTKKTVLGLEGEIFVFDREVDKVETLAKGSINDAGKRVIHVSRLSDNYGYDIESIDASGNLMFIEVKTTTGDVNTPFYMSRNELDFLKAHKENAYVYRVYDFNLETKTGQINIISAKELLTNYDFSSTSYSVVHK